MKVRALLVAVVSLALSCAAPLDGAVRSVNGAQTFLTSANVTLAELHRRARDAAVEDAETPEAALTQTRLVHARYRPAWDRYDAARSAWIVAAAATQAAIAAEAASAEPDVVRVTEAISALSVTLSRFEDAARAVRLGGAP